MSQNLSQWASEHRARIEALIVSRFDATFPSAFGQACQYPVVTGGKRLRPLLMLAAAEAVGADIDEAVYQASIAVEMLHTYSLVHDDLPAMDDDDERRGKPTVHKAYDEATAILVGDALLTEAFRVLAELPVPADIALALVAELAVAGGADGMIGGQAIDLQIGTQVQTIEELERLHRAKTGALIRCAVRMGAIAAGATESQLSQLTRYGEAVGLAFQLADDVLDEEQDAGEDGPPSFVRMLGAPETSRRSHRLVEQALTALDGLQNPVILEGLARFAVERDH